MKPFALYIHWPFCKSKCPYCDFNSHVREGIDTQAWLEAYLAELAYFAPYIQGRKLDTVFFGGGTPSLMPPEVAAAILDKISGMCTVADNLEVTLEANPTSVEVEKFYQFKRAGINRVSLGIQSLNEQDLKFLGREHNVKEALYAIEIARNTFDRYSFDLIYARPSQTQASWEAELQQALKLAGKHLSLYQLTIEKGTPFFSDYRKAKFMMPDETLSASLYQLTEDIMCDAGMPAYEVSNYAVPGQECRHNLIYWRYGEYLGIGPGAHSRIIMEGNRYALMMMHHPEHWLRQVMTQGQGIQTREPLTNKEVAEESLMMGLRLVDGMLLSDLQNITGNIWSDLLDMVTLECLIQEGLVTLHDDKLAVTYPGRLLLNAIVGRLCLKLNLPDC